MSIIHFKTNKEFVVPVLERMLEIAKEVCSYLEKNGTQNLPIKVLKRINEVYGYAKQIYATGNAPELRYELAAIEALCHKVINHPSVKHCEDLVKAIEELHGQLSE